MKCARCFLVLVFLCSALAPLAFSQDAVIVLDHKELGSHQRSLVSFDHEKHSTGIECSRCHHDYEENGTNKGGDGQPCSVCHGQKQAKARLPLEKAFHAQCKGCHEDLRAKGSANIPLLCGECHVRE